ncbi:MAG TPA: gas vesicle protein GvpJ [Actinomycetota bacterium]|nr:gas vesicle protein GvpJ [Actinomycetota bacterium]
MSPGLVPDATAADLQRQVTLLDLVDRILDKGAVVRGQVVLSVADVDLVKLDLNLLLASVDTVSGAGR